MPADPIFEYLRSRSDEYHVRILDSLHERLRRYEADMRTESFDTQDIAIVLMYAGMLTLRNAAKGASLAREDFNRTLAKLKPPDVPPYDTCVTAAKEILKNKDAILAALDHSARSFLGKEFGVNPGGSVFRR